MTEALQQITDHVWHYPYDPDSAIVQPGVSAIISQNETVLVDAGNSPSHARQVRAALLTMEAPPVRYIIYTHFHWDHTFGAQMWRNSRVIAHQKCREHLLTAYGNQPANLVRAEEDLSDDAAQEPALSAVPQNIDHGQDFELVLPHMTFTGDMTLALAGVTINLHHIGGQHASDSITVRADDTLFIGDCYYPPPMNIRQPDDTLDFPMIEQLLAENATTYIEGHNRPKSHAEFAELLDQR